MTKPLHGTIGMRALAAILVFASGAFAQAGGAVANQLPLSGRSALGGSVTSTQSPVPGTTTSVNTINPTIQVSGPYAGSAGSAAAHPFSGKLSLGEAVERALEFNLGAVGMAQAVRQARGQQRVVRSSLLPNVNGALREFDEKISLKAQGLGSVPGLGPSLPSVIGPFSYFDLRATLTQTVADMTALNNYRSSREIVRADRYSAEDAKDLIVFVVGGAYLQAIAAAARVESVRAQLETATVLFRQNSQKRGVGLLAQTDVNRSQVQALTQQQRLVSVQNDLAKQKINLARLVGLPASDGYALSENIPFSTAPSIALEDALQQALVKRADLKAAEAQAQAARFLRSAARAERLPSVSVSADYGLIGTKPTQSNGTYTVVGTVRIPIWQGGRAGGDIEQADAALTGTWGSPTLLGTFTAIEGKVLYLDRRFTVESGSANFNDATTINPVLSLQAAATVRSYGVDGNPVPYTISLSISGPLDQMVLSLTSDPTLSQPDIISLLTLGATQQEIVSRNPQSSTSAGDVLLSRAGSLTEQTLADYSTRKVGQWIGLEDLSMQGDPLGLGGSTSGSSSPQISATTRITDKISVTYQTNTGSNPQRSVRIGYYLSNRFSIATQSDQTGQSSLDLKYRFLFK